MEHDWTEEDHVDGQGREWSQVCSNCGMRRRFHTSPKGQELEVLNSALVQDCEGYLVKYVMAE